jgi:hypothetical protein
MDALITPWREELLEACEAHLAHAGSNYFPFVWRAYKSHRASLFGLLNAFTVRSTSQDTSTEEALRFLHTRCGPNRRVAAHNADRARRRWSLSSGPIARPQLGTRWLVAAAHR